MEKGDAWLMGLWGAVIVLGIGLLGGPVQAADPSGVSFTLEGCRQESLPAGYDIEGNNFLCDVGAGVDGYTTGNLGKGWNELDLVPWRVTTDAGNSAPPNQTYTIVFVVDHEDAGAPGYDVITVPTLNPSLSDSSCSLAYGPETLLSPGFQTGTDKSLYRTLTISQNRNTTCVIDGQARLAIGSHLFPGSSLHYNLGNEALGTGGIGNKDVSIPVKEIEPQSIAKTMTATQDTDFAWNITKGPNPATLNLGNTCDPANDLMEDVTIRVDWEILPGQPGMVTVITNISATNPAARTIQVAVTDEIFGDLGSGQVLLDTKACDPVNIPANTTQLVCTHTFNAPSHVTSLNDKATATYTDVVAGVPVPGTTEATASAPIQPGAQTNTTASITDVESLSGTGLSFLVKSTTGAAGTFTDADPSDGNLTWVSEVQSGDGYVEFVKTVSVAGPMITSGSLADTATLNASNGFTADASASVAISSSALVNLTITKTLGFPVAFDTTWKFKIFDKDGNQVGDEVVIDIPLGESDGSTTVMGLVPGKYTVDEAPDFGFVPNADPLMVDFFDAQGNLSCAKTVTFVNNLPQNEIPRARAQKITDPLGQEAGWDFTLEYCGMDPTCAAPQFVETITSLDANALEFQTTFIEFGDPGLGYYRIRETVKPNWDQTAVVGQDVNQAGKVSTVPLNGDQACLFEVQIPRDFEEIFQCTFTNTQRGKIIVDKVVVSTTDPDAVFDFNLSGGPDVIDQDFSLADQAAPFDSGYLKPGDFLVAETLPAGWDLVVTCDDDDGTNPRANPAAIDLDAGETVTCTFTSTERGMAELLKLTNGAADPAMQWSFTLNGPEVVATDSTPPPVVDFGGAKLVPGETYTLCETGIPPSWTIQWAVDANGNGMIDVNETLPFVGAKTGNLYEVYDPTYGQPGAVNDTRCVDFEVEPGEMISFIIDNQRPGGEPRTPGYWKNWNSCTGGNQTLTAAKNGGPAAGWFLLDDLLPTTLGSFTVQSCAQGVNILDKRDLAGRKQANDGAYELAAMLLAAKLNLAAGAETCPAVLDAVAAGDALLQSIGFNGTGSYLTTKDKTGKRQMALNLAYTLDQYNNGALCQ